MPIGPEGGSGQRPGQEELLPAEMVAELKGRDMMVARFAEMLGVPVAEGTANAAQAARDPAGGSPPEE
ncbi:MAG TPA: hypothetical protein VF933_35800 [Streptosporangiaceae bacterium]